MPNAKPLTEAPLWATCGCERPGLPTRSSLKAPLGPTGSEIRALWLGTGWSLPDLPYATALRLRERQAAPEFPASVLAALRPA
jgi:hypothetical protein